MPAVTHGCCTQVVLAFGQCVCGFDLLRSGGRSCVCDVNGWSFVKSSKKVYEDAASLLRQISMRRLCPKRLHSTRMLVPVSTPEDASTGLSDGPETPEVENENEDGEVKEDGEEMVALIAMIRHGDRTPKQKLKFKIRNMSLLDMFEKLGLRASSSSQLKLKKPKNLEHLLDVVTTMLGDAEAAKDTDLDFDKRKDGLTLDRLRQIEFVMRMHPFSGINRKGQVKATKWEGEGEDERVIEALFILKWGGELTASGKEQSQNLGRMFRQQMYPGDSQGGLLRLHSTFRHDLKMYASDEGRVQLTAAAFAKGLLDLEGDLTPILVSLVNMEKSVNKLLNDTDLARSHLTVVKEKLHRALALDVDDAALPSFVPNAVPTRSVCLVRSLEALRNPRRAMAQLQAMITELVAEVKRMCAFDTMCSPKGRVYRSESMTLLLGRWQKLEKDFYNDKADTFDISKIPDIYDCIKYDLVHNSHLMLKGQNELFRLARELARLVVSQEYGMTSEEKLNIGTKMQRTT